MEEFANDTNGTVWKDPYIESPLKEILIISFTVTSILGLCGNLLVIFVIAYNRSMRTVTNFFLANLAVADLLVSIFCIVPKLLMFVSVGWFLGDFMCKVHHYIMAATTTSSIFILTVISMERFIAILRPLETRRLLTAGRLMVAMAVVWIASALLNIHYALYHVITVHDNVTYCSIDPDLTDNESQGQQLTLVFFFIYYIIPLLIMVVLYGFICQKLWMSSKLRLVASDSEKSPGRSNRSLIKQFGRVRYLIRPRQGAAPPADQKKKGEQAALSNPEEAQVLMEAQVSNKLAGSGNQRIGPFFLDEPDEDSCPSGPVDPRDIYKPAAHEKPIRIQVDFEDSRDSSTAKDTQEIQETRLGVTGNIPPGENGQNLPNNNMPHPVKTLQPGRAHNHLSRSRPLTISKPERKSKKNKKKETIAARKKVIKLLVVVVLSFALCMLPYQVLSFYSNFGGDGFAEPFQIFIPFAYLCYFFNSALNPILYALLSDNFRKRMKETLTLRSTRRQSWMRTQARLRSMTDGNTETETVYTCT
ncbi:trissin receptor-like [Acanthaster planci]|uniref:Trissin receptor-like n=1 Tax=Acanthaster planci TaxID=133434 RepID=A0A8B7Y901_ACAPL|nr:trissin receptor-like [Acanthaster planci]XP_022088835.1 trissin receptor-like [Acanthaster planci]